MCVDGVVFASRYLPYNLLYQWDEGWAKWGKLARIEQQFMVGKWPQLGTALRTVSTMYMMSSQLMRRGGRGGLPTHHGLPPGSLGSLPCGFVPCLFLFEQLEFSSQASNVCSYHIRCKCCRERT